MERLLDGFYTLSDQTMYECLAGWRRKKVFVLNLQHWRDGRTSARVCISKLPTDARFQAEQLRNATHLVWATGGGMVPKKR